MPGKDGFELSEEIRRFYPKEELPIIGLSASLDDETRNKCDSSGMNSCEEKPLDRAIIDSVFYKLQQIELIHNLLSQTKRNDF